MKKIFIFTNGTEQSQTIEKEILEKSASYDFEYISNIKECDYIFVIGGDGAMLGLMHKYEFPTQPIVGFNAGHLGFFQEVSPDKIEHFLKQFQNEEYQTQPYNIAKAIIKTADRFYELRALNEFTIKSSSSHSVHLNISINNSFIEKYSGDGIVVATPAGSTAYNYSLGGSLVDPRLNLLQVTPMAPMNTTAYRSLTSSILLPQNDNLIIEPHDLSDNVLSLLYDGTEMLLEDVRSITLTLSRRRINLIRFNDYTFWDKVKEKFL